MVQSLLGITIESEAMFFHLPDDNLSHLKNMLFAFIFSVSMVILWRLKDCSLVCLFLP